MPYIRPDEINKYLHDHPDFFYNFPDVLHRLIIPHRVNKNVSSFIEYQAASLRKQLRKVNESIEQYIKLLEMNRKLVYGLTGLLSNLQSTKSLEQLYGALLDWLEKYYSANRVLLIIFGKPYLPSSHPDCRCLGSNSKLKFMFTEIFHRNKPLCGSLQEEHLCALFGQNSHQIKSTILLPYEDYSRQVLMVLGSYKTDRYSYGFEMEMLKLTYQFINLCLGNLITDIKNNPK
jgi:uncharacterized protein